MPYIVHRDELRGTTGTGWKRIDLLGKDVAELVGANFELLVLEPGESSPMHGHADCEHYLFVLQGEGFLGLEDGEHRIEENYVISVDPGERHAVRNSGQKKLEILEFIIPGGGRYPA